MKRLGTPLLIHQPSYSMLNRWIEDGPAGHAGARGHRVHRLLAARAGRAHREVPRWRARGLAGRPERLADVRPAQRGDAARTSGRWPRSPAARPDAGADGDLVGAAGQAGHLGADRGQQRGAAGGEPGRRAARPSSARRSWPRSTGTRWTPGSTSGPRPAPSDPAAPGPGRVAGRVAGRIAGRITGRSRGRLAGRSRGRLTGRVAGRLDLIRLTVSGALVDWSGHAPNIQVKRPGSGFAGLAGPGR